MAVWPEEHEALLKELWGEALASISYKIHKRFGVRYTPVSISHKARRLKLVALRPRPVPGPVPRKQLRAEELKRGHKREVFRLPLLPSLQGDV